jgi:hypothetical protein
LQWGHQANKKNSTRDLFTPRYAKKKINFSGRNTRGG